MLSGRTPYSVGLEEKGLLTWQERDQQCCALGSLGFRLCDAELIMIGVMKRKNPKPLQHAPLRTWLLPAASKLFDLI